MCKIRGKIGNRQRSDVGSWALLGTQMGSTLCAESYLQDVELEKTVLEKHGIKIQVSLLPPSEYIAGYIRVPGRSGILSQYVAKVSVPGDDFRVCHCRRDIPARHLDDG